MNNFGFAKPAVAVLHTALVLSLVGCSAGQDTEPQSGNQSVEALQRDLTVGDRGADVRALHGYLSRYGYYPNDALQQEYPDWRPIVTQTPAAEDTFDESTHEAILALQHHFGLTASGVVDEATRTAIQAPRCGVPDGIEKLDPSEKFARMSAWLGKLNITWKLITSTVPANLGVANAQAAARAAMATWAAQTSISFSEQPGGPGTPNANISIDFSPNADPNNLGWCPLGGQQVHLNSNRFWVVGGGSGVDPQSTMTHEVGHALGLDHSAFGAPGDQAMMFPTQFGTINRNLTSDDQVSISSLYDTFVKLPGSATDIGAGADGSVWITGTDHITASGSSILKFNPFSGFFEHTSDFDAATRIAVQADGVPWVVDGFGNIFRRSSSSLNGFWTQIPGAAKDVGVGGAGGQEAIWVIAAGAGDQPACKFNPSINGWACSAFGGVRISVGDQGIPYMVRSNGALYRASSSDASAAWTQMAGNIVDIGVGPKTPGAGPSSFIWSVANASNGQVGLAVYDDQPGSGSGGSAVPGRNGWITANQFTSLGQTGPNDEIAVAPGGRPFFVNNIGEIFKSVR
jgi:hypothetical protein